MRSLFSSKNLSALVASPTIKPFQIPRRNSEVSINLLTSSSARKQSDIDLHKFTEIQNNKVNVAAKIMGGAPANLFITEQFETMNMNFGKSISVDVENLDSSKHDSPDIIKE